MKYVSLFSLLCLGLYACKPKPPKADTSTSSVYSNNSNAITDSGFIAGDLFFTAERSMPFDLIKAGTHPEKLRSKGDTLYADDKEILLGDKDAITGMGIYKKLDSAIRFEDYRTDSVLHSKPAAPDFRSDRSALQFVTRIKEACKDGTTDFAGKYTIVEWGCGTECLGMAMVDRENGKIIYSHIPFDTADGHYGLKYRKDSRLLLVNSYLADDYPGYYLCTDFRVLCYYVWTGDRFRLVKKYPSYCINR